MPFRGHLIFMTRTVNCASKLIVTPSVWRNIHIYVLWYHIGTGRGTNFSSRSCQAINTLILQILSKQYFVVFFFISNDFLFFLYFVMFLFYLFCVNLFFVRKKLINKILSNLNIYFQKQYLSCISFFF